MKKWYIKERCNPQFDKPYYTRCGQLTKKEARAKESSAYGENFMLGFDTEAEYANKIERLISEGYRVNS